MTLKKVSSLTQIALRIYKAIVENSDIKDKSNFLVVQTALHESMFKTLNHLYRNCRKLLEAQSSRNKYDDLALYLKRLSKEYSLDKEQQSIVGLVWCKSLEAICNKLSEGDYHIRVYNWETHEVCFQIEDNNNDNMLKAQEQICASNGILFSKYYFFVFMFKTFQHLHLITQILESQKTGETKDDNPEIMELEPGAMDAFNKAAQEFLDKKN